MPFFCLTWRFAIGNLGPMFFEIYKDEAGQFRWRLKAANGENIASGQGYTTKQSCQHGVDLVKGTNGDTEVRDLT